MGTWVPGYRMGIALNPIYFNHTIIINGSKFINYIIFGFSESDSVFMHFLTEMNRYTIGIIIGKFVSTRSYILLNPILSHYSLFVTTATV